MWNIQSSSMRQLGMEKGTDAKGVQLRVEWCKRQRVTIRVPLLRQSKWRISYFSVQLEQHIDRNVIWPNTKPDLKQSNDWPPFFLSHDFQPPSNLFLAHSPINSHFLWFFVPCSKFTGETVARVQFSNHRFRSNCTYA